MHILLTLGNQAPLDSNLAGASIIYLDLKFNADWAKMHEYLFLILFFR